MLRMILDVCGVEREFDLLWSHRSEHTSRPRRRGRSICSIRELRPDGKTPIVAMGLSECGPKDVFRRDVGREVSTRRAAAFLAAWLGDTSIERQVMEQFTAQFGQVEQVYPRHKNSDQWLLNTNPSGTSPAEIWRLVDEIGRRVGTAPAQRRVACARRARLWL